MHACYVYNYFKFHGYNQLDTQFVRQDTTEMQFCVSYFLKTVFCRSLAVDHHKDRYDISAQMNFRRGLTGSFITMRSKISLVWSSKYFSKVFIQPVQEENYFTVTQTPKTSFMMIVLPGSL